MRTDLTAAARLVEDAGTAAVWIAVLLRIPAARRDRRQRGLCLAVAAAAAAMALRLGPVAKAIDLLTGDPRATQLAMHLLGALSAIVVLDFVLTVTGGGPPRPWLHIGGVFCLLTLLALDVLAPAHSQDVIGPHGAPEPSLVFWLTLVCMHLAADGTCVVVCWRYSLRGKAGPSRTSLALFSIGTAFAGLFWVADLLYIQVRSPWIPVCLSVAMGLHGLLRAASIVVPTLLDARRAAADIRVLRRLAPLWRDLIDAVPSVALYAPRHPLLETLWPRGPRDLMVYRQIVEIRDAILVLRAYIPEDGLVPPGDRETPAPRGARTHLPSGGDREAVAVARMLHTARRAKLAGRPPCRHSGRLPQPSCADVAAETDFLTRVADAYRRPVPPYPLPAQAASSPA
ncbi:MAB_1171c family putative transporter [Streptomyces sp. NPDC056160]|uniref:MAB_1171c family putative transporter n=1 Tax=Streptomyces sp. NPDC056160 TaxID=3345731 RepID=UPI0035D7D8A1